MGEIIKISIFHTNDMHGRLEAIARLSSYARRLRAEAQAQGRQVFFWDAGDAADRRIRFCSLTKGAAFMPLLNAMGYGLQALGNDLALAYGPQVLQAIAQRASFPILAANLRDHDGPLTPGLQECLMLPLQGGLTLGVFGLTAPWDDLYSIFGLHLPDFIQVARQQVERLRAGGANLVVVLSHLGLDDDCLLADEVAGIDVIIGGHSHSLLPEGAQRSGVLIVQAGDYARYLGRVDLEITQVGGKILSRQAQVLEVPQGEEPDPLVTEAIDAADQEVDALMAQPAGNLLAELPLDHFSECPIGDLAADALRERTGAQAALLAAGQFQSGLPAGEITLGQVHQSTFSTGNPGVTQVSGEQLRQALERGLDSERMHFELKAFRGAPFGFPQVSGMKIAYDLQAPAGQRVRAVWVEEQPLNPQRIYRLAHTDAESLQDGYLDLKEGQETDYEVPTILVEVLLDYLKSHQPTALPEGGRWIPA